MHNTVAFGALLLVTAMPSAPSQAGPPSPAPASANVTAPGEWEYLVISFGKTLFADPITNPELKQVGLSKLLVYAETGVVTAQEAVGIQRQMDRLGHFGWELVGLVGSIGGDQQMVFKRPYDPDRSEKEAALIRAEGERLAAEKRALLQEMAEKLAPDELVDLDAVERQERADREAAILKDEIGAVADVAIKSVDVLAFPGDEFEAYVHVVVDGTAKLLSDANKYRASEAQQFAEDVALKLHAATRLKVPGWYNTPGRAELAPAGCGPVSIAVTVVVNHAAGDKRVASVVVGGTREWSDERAGAESGSSSPDAPEPAEERPRPVPPARGHATQ